MKIAVVMVFLLCAAYPAAGADGFESVGTSYGWPDAPMGVRALGMGGAFSAVLEGPEAARWNPAVPLSGDTFAASWSRLSGDGVLLPTDRWQGAVSAELRGLRLSFIRVDDTHGPFRLRTAYLPEGTGETFEFGETREILSVSGDLTTVFLPGRTGLVTFGLGLRRAVESMEMHEADGTIESEDDRDRYGLDMGVSVGRAAAYGDGRPMGWRLSAALIDGFRAAVDEAMNPTADLRLGGAWSIEQSGRGGPLDSVRLLLAVDWTRTVLYGEDDGPWRHRLGAELLLRERLALRIGDADDDHGPREADGMWGVGIVFEDLSERFDLRLDYARSSYDATEVTEASSRDLFGVTCSYTP